MQKILIVFGTRPEAIKMAPVVKALQQSDAFDLKVCLTGQHLEMVDQVMQAFGRTADYSLSTMRPGQSLTQLTMRIMEQVEPVLEEIRPDRVLVHGDTTSALAVAQCCYHNKIPVGHVEAGLRTGKRYDPWPEEMNRKLLASLCDLHFAPTNAARVSLLAENVEAETVFVTGNTIVDATLWAASLVSDQTNFRSEMIKKHPFLAEPFVLVTSHRRENYGDGISNICEALKVLGENSGRQIVYPVHPNPNIRNLVNEMLSGCSNIHLIEPATYLEFTWMLLNCDLILTDSGGVQEEAVTLGKPILVLRETTERPEVLQFSNVKLVGTDVARIVENANSFLSSVEAGGDVSPSVSDNPFGDGKAGEMILGILEKQVS